MSGARHENGLHYDGARLEAVCRDHDVRELCIFGSAARGLMTPESDIDLLAEFGPDASPSLLDLARLRNELSDLFGRPVDLVHGRESLVNPIRRQSILASLHPIYHAA
ncbi:MAG: nucleotidyltransferase [Phycisphaeraceae bacterium]|nr:MAG: nucleotidyltransferase [Phycisphaeraceae bacterium]